MQKFWLRRPGGPWKPASQLLPFECLESKDGKKKLLFRGFWGLSRHINYLGEILMATGLSLSLGYPDSLGPWLYPLYYVALLTSRQAKDDKRCADKYGELWTAYCQKVPYRIVPYLY
jgi:protein-S-isoprenylcysteine O-methyltransferase Ste14